jgi:hypothetical protein
MQPRHGWLFPVMVLTALAMMIFGVLGISAITGHLPPAQFVNVPPGTYSLTPAVVSKGDSGAAKVPQLAQAAVSAETPPPPQGSKRLAQHQDAEAAGSGTLPN